jgi:hypothetical protein
MKGKDSIGRYETLARLREGEVAGVSPGYDEAMRRRQEVRTGKAEDPPLPPRQAITRSALELTQVSRDLGVPHAGAEALAELAATVDEDAHFVAVPLTHIVRESAGVAAGADLRAEQMEGTLQQSEEMSDLRKEATHLRRCVTDTRRGTSGELRRLSRLVVDWVQGRLDDKDMPRPDREMLRSDAAELLDCWLEVQRGPQEERDKTVAEGQRHEELLLAEEEQREALGTVLSLRAGAEVGQEEWDRAAEVYDALAQKPKPKERRGRGR